MVIPDTFGIRGERVVASYDYFDIAEGTGVIEFELGTAHDTQTSPAPSSDNTAGILNTNTFYSQDIEQLETGYDGTTGANPIIDYDFDLVQFNLPKTIRGTAIATVNSYYADLGGVAQNVYYTIIKIIKWDGSSETEIGSCYNTRHTGPTVYNKTDTYKIDLTETKFKVGDILRVNVVINYFYSGGGGTHNSNVAIGSDPKNRDGTYIKPSTDDPATTTRSTIKIPFRIDL